MDLLQPYRPVADTLMQAHGLIADDETRDILATIIRRSRTPARAEKGDPQSPLPAATKALKHARKLLQYTRTAPRRKSSVATQCAHLHAALMSASILPVALGVRISRTFDHRTLLDSLEACKPDEAQMTELVAALDAVAADKSGWQNVGRPRGLASRVVCRGCAAWILSGHPRLTYRWDAYEEALTGALPDFLRGLITCCALHVSDSALKHAIIQCRKTAYLGDLYPRAQKGRTS